MMQKYYKIQFTGGELSGRSFIVPPEGLMIGKSHAAGIRPGGNDIEIKHASLYVRETDSALILESHAESVFVGDSQLEPDQGTELAPGTNVRLGKNLVFHAEEEEGPVPVTLPSPFSPGDDEPTEDSTVDGENESGRENSEDKTRYASEDELKDLRLFLRKQTSRKKFTIAFSIILLLAIVVGGYLYT